MSPLQTIWFIFVVLPTYVIADGIQKFSRFLKEEEGRWDIFLYILTGVLILAAVYLIASGHPIR